MKNLSNILKPLTKHLSYLIPIIVVIFQVLKADGSLSLSPQDAQNIISALTSVGLGALAHQVLG